VAQMIGQAYVTAHNFVAANQDAVEKVAHVVMEKGEIYGDQLTELLDSVGLVKPELDLLKEETWPALR
jgi:hypothetical protein